MNDHRIPTYARPYREAAELAVHIAGEAGLYQPESLASELYRDLLPHVLAQYAMKPKRPAQEGGKG